MPIKGQYLKSKVSKLIVRVTETNPIMRRFSAVVIIPIATKHVGKEIDMLHPAYFEPYTPTPQELAEWGETETLSNDNPNKVEVDDKDINLRLECLKLAVMINDNTRKELSYLTSNADEIYDWITKKD